MENKNLEKELKKGKVVAMLAPSFVTDFSYPEVICELRGLGFGKVVELTFGAKLVNSEYHKIFQESKNKLLISSVCPGVVSMIKLKFPQYTTCLMPVVSPMIATSKVCKKIYPGFKTCFISPCEQKKKEASENEVDFAIDYGELKKMIDKNGNKKKGDFVFDKFYNEYTRIYPVSGGLSKTAHVKGVLHARHAKVIDGWEEIEKFLKKPDKEIKFLDCTFCKGGCIGGQYTNHTISLEEKKKRILNYLETSKKEKISAGKKGILEKAKGIDFSVDFG